jgi:hypothetical protein
MPSCERPPPPGGICAELIEGASNVLKANAAMQLHFEILNMFRPG